MTEHEQRNDQPWWAVPAPPWWLFVLFVLADAGTGAWRALTGQGGAGLFFSSLVWPGLAIAGVVFLVAWLGWSLDLE